MPKQLVEHSRIIDYHCQVLVRRDKEVSVHASAVGGLGLND